MRCNVRRPEFAPVNRDGRFDTYFHALSHDLRTPLNHINGFAELLALRDDLSGPHREYVAAIIAACGELKDTVLAHLQSIERSGLAAGPRAGCVDDPDTPRACG